VVQADGIRTDAVVSSAACTSASPTRRAICSAGQGIDLGDERFRLRDLLAGERRSRPRPDVLPSRRRQEIVEDDPITTPDLMQTLGPLMAPPAS
jgi:hypothetical protein